MQNKETGGAGSNQGVQKVKNGNGLEGKPNRVGLRVWVLGRFWVWWIYKGCETHFLHF